MSQRTEGIERVLLGKILQRPDLIPSVLARVPSDQWHPRHEILVEQLQGMVDRSETITPMAVAEQLHRVGALERYHNGVDLLDYISEAGLEPGLVDWYVGQVEDDVIRRQMKLAAGRLQSLADSPTTEPAEAIAAIVTRLGQIHHGGSAIDLPGFPDPDVADVPPDWIIPNLLAVENRVIFTGGEGHGKTMLLRQMVASVATGWHPFDNSRFEPAPAYHLDVENPPEVHESMWRMLGRRLRRAGAVTKDAPLHLDRRAFFDVTDSADVASLMRNINRYRPRLVALGPLYKMHHEDLNKEEVARRVVDVLDRIRGTGAALVVESHASWGSRNDGDWRPRGSSVLTGWPDFGFGLKPTSREPRCADLVAWRGGRAPGRHWPERLMESDGPMPWMEDPR